MNLAVFQEHLCYLPPPPSLRAARACCCLSARRASHASFALSGAPLPPCAPEPPAAVGAELRAPAAPVVAPLDPGVGGFLCGGLPWRLGLPAPSDAACCCIARARSPSTARFCCSAVSAAGCGAAPPPLTRAPPPAPAPAPAGRRRAAVIASRTAFGCAISSRLPSAHHSSKSSSNTCQASKHAQPVLVAGPLRAAMGDGPGSARRPAPAAAQSQRRATPNPRR